VLTKNIQKTTEIQGTEKVGGGLLFWQDEELKREESPEELGGEA
jgi:hypothetical protein